jgi:hypothetical protein
MSTNTRERERVKVFYSGLFECTSQFRTLRFTAVPQNSSLDCFFQSPARPVYGLISGVATQPHYFTNIRWAHFVS